MIFAFHLVIHSGLDQIGSLLIQDYPEVSADRPLCIIWDKSMTGNEMSAVVKQTAKVFRRAVQFFQGESGNYFDYAPAISGVAIVLYIK